MDEYVRTGEVKNSQGWCVEDSCSLTYEDLGLQGQEGLQKHIWYIYFTNRMIWIQADFLLCTKPFFDFRGKNVSDYNGSWYNNLDSFKWIILFKNKPRLSNACTLEYNPSQYFFAPFLTVCGIVITSVKFLLFVSPPHLHYLSRWLRDFDTKKAMWNIKCKAVTVTEAEKKSSNGDN